MALFDDLTKKAAKLTEKTIEKSGELADSAKLKIAIKSQEADLDDVYKELGKRYYNLLKNPELDDDSFDLVTKADQILAKIEELKNQE